MSNKILLVEDELSIRQFTKISLEREGFMVYQAGSGEEGVEKCKEYQPDAVILDIMLPGIDGYETCIQIRRLFPNIGIIMLTAKAQDVDKILGLESGTDDYMVKPFNPKELVLRVKSLLRRLNLVDEGSEIIKSGEFKLNKYSRKFYKNDIEIELTPTELSIINLFISNPGKAFSRTEILDLTWGQDYVGDSKIVDVNIRRIRAKIEDTPSKPKFLETVWGIGYRWNIK